VGSTKVSAAHLPLLCYGIERIIQSRLPASLRSGFHGIDSTIGSLDLIHPCRFQQAPIKWRFTEFETFPRVDP
jgi:hypothetical protein